MRTARLALPFRIRLHLACAAIGLLLFLAGAAAHAELPPKVVYGSTQLVVVTTGTWDDSHGRLQRFERDGEDSPWRRVGAAVEVSIGRNGSAWGDGSHARSDQDAGPVKREGDGRSPAGIFPVGAAFGYAPAAEVRSGLPYAQMDAGHWCMDVPGSPLYNRIVDAREAGARAVAGSTEPMRLDIHNDGDPRYRLGLVIEHNRQAVPGRGSCIFAHLWRTPGETTAGCTAMSGADMETLLAWIDAAARPRLVLLPVDQYRRLAGGWQLPPADAVREPAR